MDSVSAPCSAEPEAARSMFDVARASHISPETLRKIESGRVATPAFPAIAAIADTLGLSLHAVWAEISQPERTIAAFVGPRSEGQQFTDRAVPVRLPAC